MDMKKKQIQKVLSNASPWSISVITKELVRILKEDPVEGSNVLAQVCLHWQSQECDSTSLIVEIIKGVSDNSSSDVCEIIVKLVHHNILVSRILSEKMASGVFASYLLLNGLSTPEDAFSVLNKLLLKSATTVDLKVVSAFLGKTSSLLMQIDFRKFKDLLHKLDRIHRYSPCPETSDIAFHLGKRLASPQQGDDASTSSATKEGGFTRLLNIFQSSIHSHQAIKRLNKLHLHPAFVSRTLVRLCITNSFCDKLYTEIADTLCRNNSAYTDAFVSLFSEYFTMAHTLTDKHLTWFFGSLINSEVLASEKVFSCVKQEHMGLTTTSDIRAFVYLFLTEIVRGGMTLVKLKRKLHDAGVDIHSEVAETFLETIGKSK